MTTSDWITLGAAILVGGGTLFLGIMALRTIRQTRSIQKAEKRERLLNEIIEWAIGVTNWRSESKKIFKEMVERNIQDEASAINYLSERGDAVNKNMVLISAIKRWGLTKLLELISRTLTKTAQPV